MELGEKSHWTENSCKNKCNWSERRESRLLLFPKVKVSVSLYKICHNDVVGGCQGAHLSVFLACCYTVANFIFAG